MEKHNDRKHALLSASQSNRWINCTPSARLEETVPDLQQSDFAAEGTLAHELAQLYLIAGTISAKEFESKLEDIYNNRLFDVEMLDEVPKYVEYCEDAFEVAETRTPDAIMLIEQKLDFSKYVPEGFGTGDCVIIADGEMETIDLKYGKGVLVEAEGNTQARLYALGAYEKFSLLFDIKTIKMTIIQPRRNNFSSETMSVEELLAWAEEVLVPAAINAWNGEGEQVTGPWCKFCKVKAQCRTLAKQNLELAKEEFKPSYLLSDDEIAEVLHKAPLVLEWVNAIQQYAFNEALTKHKQWPGFKLVEGVSRRKWLDEVSVEQKLNTITDLSEDDKYVTKLKPLTSIEKVLGKKRFNEELGALVIKPAGAPTLVPIDDKRPAIGPEQAKLDFS